MDEYLAALWCVTICGSALAGGLWIAVEAEKRA